MNTVFIEGRATHGSAPTGEVLALIRDLLQKLILFPVLRSFSPEFKILGLEKLERLAGPCVFVANHSSHADTAIILYALPERLRSGLAIAAAADYFYKNSFVAALVTLVLNTFPFVRSNPKQGLKKAREVLCNGNSLLIYPEGTRKQPREHVCFKTGFAALACQLSLPVVPIRIEGSYEMLPKGVWLPRRSSIRISFAEPVYPVGQSRNELAHLVESRVDELLAAA